MLDSFKITEFTSSNNALMSGSELPYSESVPSQQSEPYTPFPNFKLPPPTPEFKLPDLPNFNLPGLIIK